MQSGLGLFFNGNDPFNLHNSYATSSYDRTHVAVVQYHYEIPNRAPANSLLGKFTNGWALNGVTVFQSGQSYDGIDFSGAVGGIYYANFVEILDPVMPIKPGMTVQQALLQGTTGIDPNKPLLNASAFYVPTLAPGTFGVPCTTVSGSQVCDTVETGFRSEAHRDRSQQAAAERLGILRPDPGAGNVWRTVHYGERQPGVRHSGDRLRRHRPQHE